MTLWLALRRKLKVATCFASLMSTVTVSIILSLALRDMLPVWFDFQPMYSDNLRDSIKFYYLVSGLFQPYDFKFTVFLLSPIFLIHQYFEITAVLAIEQKLALNEAFLNETHTTFITNLEIFRAVSMCLVVCLTIYCVQLEFSYLVIEREAIRKE